MKIKRKIKKNQKVLVVKSDNNQQLCYREYSVLKGKNSQFLPVEVKKDGSKLLLTYDLMDYISLEELLQEEILSKKLFIVIIKSMVSLCEWIDNNHFNKDLVVGNVSDIYFDLDRHTFRVLYIPLQPYESGFDISKICMQIIQKAAFDSEEDTTYIETFITMLNSGKMVSEYDLKRYANEIEKQEGERCIYN